MKGRSVQRPSPVVCTNRTNRTGLTMSADRGRPEVTFQGREDRFYPARRRGRAQRNPSRHRLFVTGFARAQPILQAVGSTRSRMTPTDIGPSRGMGISTQFHRRSSIGSIC
jgi:hypothetical protein